MKSSFRFTQSLNCKYLEPFQLNSPDTSQKFGINANALNIVVVFYVTSATVLFYSISSTEITEVGKFYRPINISVGINMFMNGKLDSSFKHLFVLD